MIQKPWRRLQQGEANAGSSWLRVRAAKFVQQAGTGAVKRARAKNRRNARKHTNSTAPGNTQKMRMSFLKFSVDFLIFGSDFRVSYPVFLDPSKNMFFLKADSGCMWLLPLSIDPLSYL